MSTPALSVKTGLTGSISETTYPDVQSLGTTTYRPDTVTSPLVDQQQGFNAFDDETSFTESIVTFSSSTVQQSSQPYEASYDGDNPSTINKSLSAAEPFESVNGVSNSSNMAKSPVEHAINWFDTEWIIEKKRELDRKLYALQKLKKKRMQDSKIAAHKLERTLPLDLLAKDWFNENALTSELRVYLIDKLLPTLVLGMEKLLVEAQKKGFIDNNQVDTEEKHRFNPINLLAQFLMRNNPRYCQLHDSSPYVRGLKKVAEHLKRDVYHIDTNKLARLKSEAERKRIAMEEQEKQKEEDRKERAKLLKMQFGQWLLGPEGRLQLQLIQNALFSYLEISSHLATDSEIVTHYSKELEATDETGISLNISQYVQYIEEYVCEMSMYEFKQLIRHLDQCAFAFRKTFEHEVWKDMFLKLFESLDSESTGYIDRHRMLHLLEKFYDKLEEETRPSLHNPRKWPVIELEELDDLYPDSDDEDRSGDETVNVSTEEVGSSEWASIPVSGLTQEETTPSDLLKESEKENEVCEKEAVVDGAPDEIDQNNDEEADAKVLNLQTQDALVEKVEDNRSVAVVSSVEGEDKVTDPVTVTDEAVVTEAEDPAPDVTQTTKEDNDETKVDVIEEKTPDSQRPATTVTDTVEDPKSSEEIEDAPPAIISSGDNETAQAANGDGIDGNISETNAEDSKTEVDAPKVEEPAPGVEEKSKFSEDTASDVNVKEDENEQVPTEGENNAEKFVSSTSNLAASLVTPAPSAESVDVGPVNIQFSKEEPQSNVRKTKSLTVVKKKPDDATELETGNGLAISTLPSVIGATSSDIAQKQLGDGDQDSETVVTTLPDVSEAIVVQHTAEDMKNDYYPQPVDVKTRPASASRMSVTFAAEPLILPDRPSAEFFSNYSSRSQSRMTSVFDENQLNQGRFVSLLENFVTDDTDHVMVEQLVNFVHGGYVETEEEKMSRLARARKEALSAKHRQMVDRLFNIWDNNGQGNVEYDEVEDVLSKYKGGMESGALKRGRQVVRQMRKNAPYHDRRRLNKKEFHVYINTVCAEMTGGEEVFDGVVEYLTSTVERTYAERVRGDARRKWLAQIQSAAETGGASMESVYRTVFQTLFKDADAHGNQKKTSGYVALLEHNSVYPHRGNILLRYVACTPDNAPHMLGKAYYEDMRGISFYAVRRGKLVHVPRVQSHGRIHFWNQDRQDGEREGSLVLVPLKDARRRTYGLIGIDNVDNAPGAERSIFASHEISFYQGISKTFSGAFHHVDLRRKLLRIIDAAMSWVHSRAPKVRTIVIYLVEPDPKGQASHVLRKMMTADNNKGVTTAHARPNRLYRKDNLFRDYLFKCVDNSETTSADAYGERHTAYPLRDDNGRCQCVIDISIGSLKKLPRHEYKEVQRMLKLLQAANREVMRESISGEKTVVLEAEERGSDDTRVDIMFDRLMLTDLRENVGKLDNNLFAELKNYKEPPPMIHNILKAVLLLFYTDPEQRAEFDDWVNCKQMLTAPLRQQIISYDPTSDKENGETEAETDEVVKLVGGLLKGIAHGAVAKHGSRPAQQLYNWAFVCLSLIEHARKMRQNEGQPAVTPVTSASTNLTTESGTDVAYNESVADSQGA